MLKVITPLTPDEPAFAVRTVMAPPPLVAPEPLVIEIDPPVTVL